MQQSKARAASSFFLGIALVAVLLQIASGAKHDALVFPSVSEIFKAFIHLLCTAHTYTLIGTTLLHLVVSLFFATVIGVAIGFLEGVSPFLRTLFTPLITLFRTVPFVVLVVIVMVLSPYTRVPFIVPVIALVPLISEASYEGLARIDREFLDIYRLNGSCTPYVLCNVHLPLMAGYLKQAYINAVGTGIKLIVSAEYLVQTKDSLGKAVNTSIYFSDYQDIYAYALIMILLVVILSEFPLFLLKLPKRRQIR